MSINSKKKGSKGELEFANLLKEYGFEDARRSQQYAGINNDADVVGLDGIHIEVKRVENLNINKAMDQALRDKAEDEAAIVAHRKNHKDWKVTMKLEDWKLLRKSSQNYLTELKIVSRLQLDKLIEGLQEESEILGYKPLLIHGLDKSNLLVTVFFEEWIMEYKEA